MKLIKIYLIYVGVDSILEVNPFIVNNNYVNQV